MSNNKTKVLHIITRFLKWGGADLNTYYSIQALDSERYEVDLVVGRDSHLGMLQDYDKGELIQINSLVRNPNPFLDLVALFKLFQLIRKEDYKIVHTHTGKAGVLGRIAAKMAGTSVIVHGLHGSMESQNPVLNKIYTWFDKFTGSFTDKFVSVGEDLKNKYINKGVGNPEDYTVIHSGMELKKFYEAEESSIKEELGIPKDSVVLGKVASLEPRKGHRYLIKAAKKLIQQHPEAVFLLVGDGWYRDELEEKVKQTGLEDHVVFTGFRKDIEQVMACFDVFVFTSLWEGLPQVLVQACAEGIPIVSFDVEGAKEVIKQGENGFVVPSKDIDAFVEKVNYLLSDLERAKQMGKEGQNIIGEEWTIETMQRKTRELYNNLLKDE